jgi:cytochrome c biogenesis protein CcdA/thiol-disulfide isomerase/thioredoxin
MILLLIFAFLAGVVTILSPCILPILPIVLSSTIGGVQTGKSRPIGVVVGFVLSFTFFTLFLSTIVRFSGISADSLRLFSVIVIALFGVSFLIPQFQVLLEKLFSRLAQFVPQGNTKTGFWPGVLIGLSIGLLWTPCVGPILASVISLAITGTVTLDAFLITFAYALGTAIPMFLIMLGGQKVLQKVPWLLANTANIQKAFGVVMIATAIAIFFNIDRQFQTFILKTFPQYGVGLTKFEDNATIKDALKKINQQPVNPQDMGKPLSDMNGSKGPVAPEIIAGGEWFNSKPLKLSELRGKVVIIDFWTYSCINCQRTFPYLRTWFEKYKDDGLVIIGVHSPEFEFEKNPKNVAQAAADFDLQYPIVQDNDFATWKAYSNRYWPAKYIIDKDGLVRYTHFGEGAYDETEKIIQELLSETGKVTTEKIENPTYDIYGKTPELYLGYLRMEHLASPEYVSRDTKATYTGLENIPQNYFVYEGEWTVMPEYSAPAKGAKLRVNFESKEVFLVMRPKNGIAKMKVLLDGKAQYFGADVKDGVVTVDKDTLYKLIMLPEAGRHLLELQFEDDNMEVYAFTFG